MIHVTIPADSNAVAWHWLFAAIIAALVLTATLTIHGWWLRQHRLPPLPHARKVLRKPVHHGVLPLLILVLAALTLPAAVAFAVGTGARFESRQHVRPQARIVAAGGLAPRSVDLTGDYPAAHTDQGATNSCGGQSLTAAYDAARVVEGYAPADVYSPGWTYWHTPAGPSGGYTTMDQEWQSLTDYGAIYNYRQPWIGQPPWGVGGYASYPDMSYVTLFYGAGQAGALDTIRAALDASDPVIVLAEYREGMNAGFAGQSIIVNDGQLLGYHFMALRGYRDTGGGGADLLVRQSYGSRYGAGGDFTLAAQSFGSIVAAYALIPSHRPTIPAPSPPPRPHPTAAAATARPRVRPTPTPRATATPTARATRTPPPTVYRHFRVLADTSLQRLPRADAPAVMRVRRGWILIGHGRATPHWQSACLMRLTWRCGWVRRFTLRPLP